MVYHGSLFFVVCCCDGWLVVCICPLYVGSVCECWVVDVHSRVLVMSCNCCGLYAAVFWLCVVVVCDV